jgi:hypothetical protein
MLRKSVRPPSSDALLLQLTRLQNSDLRAERETLQAQLQASMGENERLQDELVQTRRVLEEALAAAAEATAAATAAASVAGGCATTGQPGLARSPKSHAPPQPTLLPRAAISGNIGASTGGSDEVSHRGGSRGTMRSLQSHATSAPVERPANTVIRPHSARTAGHTSARTSKAVPSAAALLAEQDRRRQQAAAANAAAAANQERHRQQVARERAARRAEVALAAMTLQAHARGAITRWQLWRWRAAEDAALRLQAVVRGNAARGIVERRRFLFSMGVHE